MASDPQPDDDLSPQDFLRRVRAMTEERDREDRQRVTEIEKDIMQSREQRRARRADHARSLSNTPIALDKVLSPTTTTKTISAAPLSDREITSPTRAEVPTVSRSNTLSWQQRRRPLSQIALENNHLQNMSPELPLVTPEKEPARADISQTLAAKDPSWFRQTPDRGIGSAALRRTPEPETGFAESFKLPAIDQEPRISPINASPRLNHPRKSSKNDLQADHHDQTASQSIESLQTELGAMDTRHPSTAGDAHRVSPRLEPNASANANSGRTSPTKGMGGFVQSAMMKRSDSVNKRWSTTQTPGLQRAGSTAGDRSSYLGRRDSVKTLTGVNTTPKPNTSNRLSGLSSTHPLQTTSRPTSTYITNNPNQDFDDNRSNAAGRDESLTKPHGAEAHNRSRSVASLRSTTPIPDEQSAAPSPPLSPSKRWSPTKSSWLESKLSQPEDKPKATPPPAQPSWMANLAKAKQQRSSTIVQDAEDLTGVADAPTMAESLKSSQQPPKPTAIKPDVQIQNAPNPLLARKFSNAQSPPTGPKPVSVKPLESSKIDFRANLKSRAPPPGPKQDDKPEFQNRFGNLRKAETKNFVAPDELKNNILRGKAGLAQTGGPAKRERVDELKESLLKKKEEMKAKAANDVKISDAPKETIIPEALLRRQRMSKGELPKPLTPKPDISTKTANLESPRASIKTLGQGTITSNMNREGLATLSRENSTSSNPGLAKNVDLDKRAIVDQSVSSQQSFGNAKLANKINPALANLLARGPPDSATASQTNPSPSKPSDEASEKSRELTHMTKGRARGPKRRAPKNIDGRSKSPVKSSSKLDVPVHIFRLSDLSLESTSPGPKNLSFSASPTSSNASEQQSQMEDVQFEIVPAKPQFGLPANPKVNINNETQPPTATKSLIEAPQIQTTADLGTFDFNTEDTQSMPATPAKTKSTRASAVMDSTSKAPQESPNKTAAAKFGGFNFGLDAFDIDNDSTLPSPEPIKSEAPRAQTPIRQVANVVHLDMSTPTSQPESPTSPLRSPGRISVKEAVAREVKTTYVVPPDFQKSASPLASPTRSPVAVSVRDAASRWSNAGTKQGPPSRVGAKSPIKLPKQEDEDNAMIEAGLKSAPAKSTAKVPKAPTGLGLSNLQINAATNQGKSAAPKLTISPASIIDQNEEKQQTSPIKRSRPPSMTIKVPPPDSPLSPIPHTSEAARMFSEIFDDQPRLSGSTEIDVLSVIQNYPIKNEKIETIKSQMQELSEDGTLTPMPNGREHILFEDSMYVCVHIFKDGRFSRNTHVYFWTGQNVQAADAQMYARNIAKVNTGRFIPVKQGKEPSAFFQALGGIIITFRGSRVKKRESTGLPEKFILCGRKHLGHIAFDEVDFARTSFCSGFPYLVSNLKDLYLWRGAGASADELGCARLIAMDIGLTPDVTEIIEGQESASFLKLFPAAPNAKIRSPGIPPSATHWRLKASIGDKYRSRLFRITQENVSLRKNSTFQVSNFFGGLASSAAHLLPTSMSPATPSLASPVSSLQSPFTESSVSDKKSISLLASSQNTPRTAELPSEVACNVDEIVPFCREDLQGEGIWILDAFFEVYIILSPLSTSQNHAFSAALLFAQDYVILAASVEDRPFIPVSTVVLEGAPKDMRAVFRRWTDQNADGSAPTPLPTSKLMAGKPLKRGGSMRTVGLAAALAAVQR